MTASGNGADAGPTIGDGVDAATPPATKRVDCEPGSTGCSCAWGAPQRLVDSIGRSNNFAPTLAADGLGNAHLFWGEGDPLGNVAWKAARFDASTTTWTKGEGPGPTAPSAFLAADDHGSALEIGPAVSGQSFSVYDLASGAWSPPAAMPVGGWGSVAMSPNGSAVAVSGQFVPVSATVYDPVQKKWSEPQTLTPTYVDIPTLAIDDEGNAVVAFIDVDGPPIGVGSPFPATGHGISVCRFDAKTRIWSPPAQAYVGAMGYSGTGSILAVSARPDGRASIVFVATGLDILVTEFDPATNAWTTAASLPSPYAITAYPWLLASASGHAVLVATGFKDDAGNRTDIVASQLDVATNVWSPFASVVPDGTPADTLAGGIAPNGDAVIAWHHYNNADQSFSEYTERYDVTSGKWMPREAFTNTDGTGAIYVTLSMSAAGTTFASWLDVAKGVDPQGGSRRLWVNRWACTKR